MYKSFHDMIAVTFSIILLLTTCNSQAASTSAHHRQLPLVLIHAFPTDQRLWKPQQDGLGQHFYIITMDLPGFGKSSTTNGQAITMDQYADHIKAALDAKNLKKIILGGESMGGYIALAFLKRYPEYVEMLVLSDTQVIADSAETKAIREAAAQDVLANGSAKLVNDFMQKALSASASEDTRKYLFNIASEQNPRAIASALRGMALREDTTEVLIKTDIPVLILTGDNDLVISSKQSEYMHKLAKNSRLVVIKNAGHLSNLEQPQQWNQAVLDMFRGD